MGIYFRDILLISISRGANNCGQHALEKNIYFIMRFSPHFQLFYFSDRLEFCEFFEWKIKRINNADLFSQTPFLTFIKGANISGGHCIYLTQSSYSNQIWMCILRNELRSGRSVLYYGFTKLKTEQNSNAVFWHTAHSPALDRWLWVTKEHLIFLHYSSSVLRASVSPITALDVGLDGGSAPSGMTLWSQTWIGTQHLTLFLHQLMFFFFNEDYWMEMFRKVYREGKKTEQSTKPILRWLKANLPTWKLLL